MKKIGYVYKKSKSEQKEFAAVKSLANIQDLIMTSRVTYKGVMWKKIWQVAVIELPSRRKGLRQEQQSRIVANLHE